MFVTFVASFMSISFALRLVFMRRILVFVRITINRGFRIRTHRIILSLLNLSQCKGRYGFVPARHLYLRHQYRPPSTSEPSAIPTIPPPNMIHRLG